MPPQIGDTISKHVYDSKLKSWDDHPITSATPACHFVDVEGGVGISPPTGGTSFIVILHSSTFILTLLNISPEYQGERCGHHSGH
jgi:hypothetical protein